VCVAKDVGQTFPQQRREGIKPPPPLLRFVRLHKDGSTDNETRHMQAVLRGSQQHNCRSSRPVAVTHSSTLAKW
jgi:hypothetical protein